ncbi:MAG: KpsF/GutQ family sugar-phosphate isomerase [Deltaproteobacteria bacterium]|nr:KpsF/GutQ family sugar-phosphate isomerase [Deltaproteobacteria bacterium]
MTKSTLDIAREALEIEIQGIKSVIARLDKSFESVVDLLYSLRGRIIVTGVGKSGIIGRKIAATFTSTGSPAIFVHPVEGLHGDVGIVGRDDALIAISNSGETTEITSLAATVRKWGTGIVAMTGNTSSTLARMAQVTLDCRVDREACPLNMAPTASTTAMLALGDALAVALMVRRGFNKEDFLRSHPAGSLGERLNLKVKDMTLESVSVPQVSPSAKMPEIIESINGKNLGLTMVTSENAVLGIITDGDLRRALADGADLFEKEARHLMTQNPLGIRSDRTAAEALEIMERKLITALAVTDHDGKWLGIIHLHDLLGKGQVRFVS